MGRKLRRGDTVQVMKGRDRGKQGQIQRVLSDDGRLLVEGVNQVRRHQRPRPGLAQAGIITIEAPIHASNVQVICPNCNRPVRVGFTFLSDGRKVRYCKRCKETLE